MRQGSEASPRRLRHCGLGDRGRRLLRPDAWSGAARQHGRSVAAGADLVRSAHRRRSARTNRLRRRSAVDRLDLQSRADKLHAHQAAVGAQARGQTVRTLPNPAPSQRLRPLSLDGRVRHGHGRRFRHFVARRRQSPLVGTDGERRRDRHLLSCAALRITRCLWQSFRGGRAGDRSCGKALPLWQARAIRLRARWGWGS